MTGEHLHLVARKEPPVLSFVNKYWHSAVSRMDYALQPIINIHTGRCYGLEALLRGFQEAGFSSIGAVFDKAYQDGVLHEVDLLLREKAIEKFVQLPESSGIKLFFNLDNRVLVSGNFEPEETKKILARKGLPEDAICFEISERNEITNISDMLQVLGYYRAQGFKVAVDDCGTGFSGLQLLYYTKPDFIKIDRFFIDTIAEDTNKKLLVSSIVNIAHLTGSLVVAEGVETRQEYFSCRDIGCDLIQGYLVQRPETDLQKIRPTYDHIHVLSRSDRRDRKADDRDLIKMEMEYIQPISHASHILEVFDRFREKKTYPFYPVVNQHNEPLGVIFASSLNDYAYSRFGRELLENPAFGGDLKRFVSRFPIADIHSSAEKILEVFSHNESIEGIILVDGMKYAGFLSAHSLLRVLNEKNLAIARDQNPLSKLPGNTLIYSFVSEALNDTAVQYNIIYFDFDNFKPYNDTYGFRSGDRVILLFAELLKSVTQSPEYFAGHIGGDDFFMGVKGHSNEKVSREVEQLIARFKSDVESFYDAEALAQGYITAKNRHGDEKQYPLLTVSAVMLEFPEIRPRVYSTDEISALIAKHKKEAKQSPSRYCSVSICELDEIPAAEQSLCI